MQMRTRMRSVKAARNPNIGTAKCDIRFDEAGNVTSKNATSSCY